MIEIAVALLAELVEVGTSRYGKSAKKKIDLIQEGARKLKLGE